MQAQLDEVWYLQMNIGSFTDDLVPAVFCVLRETPELSTLYLRYKPTSLDPKSNVKFVSFFIHHSSSICFMLYRDSAGSFLLLYLVI